MPNSLTFVDVKFKWLPLFLIIVLGCIWGSSFILMKRGLTVFTPIQVAGMRLVFAGIFLTPGYIDTPLAPNRGPKNPHRTNPKNSYNPSITSTCL